MSFALVALLHRTERPREFPPPPVWWLMGLFLALMAWDGVTSYAGVRETTNAIRLITGLGVGFSAAVVTYPMLQDEVWARAGASRVLDPPWRAGVWALGIPATFAGILWGAPWLGVLYPVLVTLSIVATLTLVNLIIVAMLPAFDRRGARLWDLRLPVLLAVGLALAEIAISAYLRLAIIGLVR
jgi:hypothetical protein